MFRKQGFVEMTQLLSINEVAAFLSVHRNTVVRWFDDGKFPNAIQIEKTVRIPLSDIEALKAQSRREA